jgi:hypothetical protein
MSTPQVAQTGIKNAWRLACRLEGINPRHPDRLPELFALDTELAIADGFHYALNCHNAAQDGKGTPLYCASSIGCSSGCGSGCGAGCGSGCGAGCSSGDSGCGGGCGGGD